MTRLRSDAICQERAPLTPWLPSLLSRDPRAWPPPQQCVKSRSLVFTWIHWLSSEASTVSRANKKRLASKTNDYQQLTLWISWWANSGLIRQPAHRHQARVPINPFTVKSHLRRTAIQIWCLAHFDQAWVTDYLPKVVVRPLILRTRSLEN